MSRHQTPAAVSRVAPRTFTVLVIGFLLLYAGVLVAARQQKAARSQLESLVALPPRSEPAPASPEPAPTPTEP